MKKEEYLEVEVIKNTAQNNKGQDNKEEKYQNSKKFLFWKILSLIWPQILAIFIFILVIFAIIFLLFESPFDYLISAILLYFIIKGIWKMRKFLHK